MQCHVTSCLSSTSASKGITLWRCLVVYNYPAVYKCLVVLLYCTAGVDILMKLCEFNYLILKQMPNQCLCFRLLQEGDVFAVHSIGKFCRIQLIIIIMILILLLLQQIYGAPKGCLIRCALVQPPNPN